jgi:peptide-methionine (S)-S-oxide reductase
MLLVAAGLMRVSNSAAEEARPIPAPMVEAASTGTTETAIFAGGCFWGVQGVFQHVDGVGNAVSGYAGGDRASATYDLVSSGGTGHAEAVEITFDPNKISYARLLQILFSVAHDPTQLNRQGPDVGTQYRSAIFPTSPEQARVAKAYIEQLDQARTFGRPIATRIEPGKTFYPAEDYHQDFMTRNPTYPYIVFHDLPKLEALKRIFPERYRVEPALVAASTN